MTVVTDHAREVCDEILNFIGEHTRLTGFQPNYREISAHTGLRSLSSVARYMHHLAALGLVEFHPDGMRWRVVE